MNLEFLERLAPQWMIAGGVILIAIMVIVIKSPEFEYCEAEKSALARSEREFIMSRNYNRFFKRCLNDSRPGACAPYFNGMNRLVDHFNVLEESCFQEVGKSPKIRKVLTDFLLETTRMAWGDEGPVTYYGRVGWFGPEQLRVICRVKNLFQAINGERDYQIVEKKIVSFLPEPEGLSRFKKDKRVKYQNTVLAEPCGKYL